MTERLQFRRSPLLFAAVAMGCGIACAHVIWQPTGMAIAALLALAAVLLVAQRWAPRAAHWPVLAIWSGVGFLALSLRPPPVDSTRLQGFADNLSREVQATVIRVRVLPPANPRAAADADNVMPWEAAELVPEGGEQSVSVDLAVEAIEQVTPDVSTLEPASGVIRVTFYAGRSPLRTLACGERIRVPLRLKLPGRFRDPGAWQYADYLAEQGIVARASAPEDSITPFGYALPTLACRLGTAQAWASGRLAAFVASPPNHGVSPFFRLNEGDAHMLDAMLFGDRTGLDHTLRTAFERTGSFHLFVVSGLHVALLAGLVFWLLRRLRAPDWLATILTLLATTAYAALTGFGQPAQRSLAMIAVFLVARLFSRERDALNALGAAALAMLLWAPASLFDASLQMTLLAVVAIAGIARPLAEATILGPVRAAQDCFRPRRAPLSRRLAQFRLTLELLGELLNEACSLPNEHWLRKAPAAVVRTVGWAGELALVGIVTELVMVLPMALYFHRAAALALPANMLVIPLIAVLAPAAVATFAASLLSPWLALAPGALTAALLHGITFAIGRLSQTAAADVRVPGPAAWVALLAVAGFGLCCWAVRRGRTGVWTTMILLPCIATGVLWPEPPVVTPGALELTAIDVGQGDSLLAVSPEGRTMLIDGGGPVGRHGVAEIVASFDVGEQVVAPYLWSRRCRRLDVMVLSHAHTDHMGGLPALLRDFRPRELWVGIDPDSALYRDLLAEAATFGVMVRHLHAGDRAGFGSVAVSVLSPDARYNNAAAPRNDDSLVLRLDLGRASVLLEGDAEKSSESTMLAAHRVAPVTLLKVGHHGSATSSTQEFLAAAAPVDAVISSGKGNSFGHPRADVVARLAAQGSHVFRLDELGLSTFLLRPDGSVTEIVNGTALPAHPSATLVR